jgi:hypothetical protein
MSKFAIKSINTVNLEHIRTAVLPAMEDKNPFLLFAALNKDFTNKCPVSDEVLDAMRFSKDSRNNKMLYFWAGVYAMLLELYQEQQG